MTDNTQCKTIICEEVFDENSLPSEEEVAEYAKKIGIDPLCEPQLLPIALNGLMQPLPQEWKPCFDSNLARWYYYNKKSKESQWEHPLDSVYRDIVKRGRSEGYSSAADDDSKNTAREELKSFEEVSDLLSSKSTDIKDEMERNKVLPKSHQPLLMRRKQLQSGADVSSLQVAKMMNNTMRENLLSFDDKTDTNFKSASTPFLDSKKTPVAPRQLQPLRRAQTLDPIPTFVCTKTENPPIKGILRESSFSGLPSRNLARLNPIQGELSTAHDIEDEKKRSVRFADFERKSLDVRFQFSDSEGSLSDGDKDDSSSPQELNIKPIEKESVDKIKEKIINTQTPPPKLSTIYNADFSEENVEKFNEDMDEIAKKKTSERMLMLEEKITKEIQEKAATLKKQQVDSLKKISDTLVKDEEEKCLKLTEEAEKRIKELELSLNEKYKQIESDLRQKHKTEVDNLISKLENEKDNAIASVQARYDSLYEKSKKEQEESLHLAKNKLELESNSKLQKSQEELRSKIENLKAEEENTLALVKCEGTKKIEDLKKMYEQKAKEEEVKFQNVFKTLEIELNTKMNNLKIEKESELKLVQTEWDDKIMATTLQYKAFLNSAAQEHEKSIANMRIQLQKEEDELKRKHSEQIEAWNARLKKLTENEPNSVSVNRDFEKMRCEKRLIEDKYRSLKDKYIQLKTDMKIAVDRKLQSRARRKKDENKEECNEPKKEVKIRNDNDFTDRKVARRISKLNAEHEDRSSDEQYTSLSLTLPNDDQRSLSISPVKSGRKTRLSLSSTLDQLKESHVNVLEQVRNQLQELDGIEDKIPPNSQGITYLRYPFEGHGISNSAEVDFYRHRMIVEQEAVKTARECLIKQKLDLEAKQNFLKTNNNFSNMEQLQKQERDLTEMEVSLHRTRALLGEKMIRLRLLGQTLNRLVEDSPNVENANIQIEPRGAYEQEVSHAIPYNIEAINSEIKEIWDQLGKLQDASTSNLPTETYYGSLPKPLKQLRRVPSNRAEIEARLQGLREWLQKPPPTNTDWNQLTI